MKLNEPLRICRRCELKAYTKEDLERFVRNRTGAYGYLNLCKKCHCEDMKQRVNRTAEFINIFRTRSPDNVVTCYFCGEEVTKLRGRNHDSLVIHSLDENHDNWKPENKEPAHKDCHHRYHNTGEKSHNWKGEKASNSAKRKRVNY